MLLIPGFHPIAAPAKRAEARRAIFLAGEKRATARFQALDAPSHALTQGAGKLGTKCKKQWGIGILPILGRNGKRKENGKPKLQYTIRPVS